MHTQCMLPEVHPRTVRPTERSPPVQSPDSKSRGTRDKNAVRLRHVEPARVPLRHAAPSPSQLPDLLHRLAKEQSHRPSDFLSSCLFSVPSWRRGPLQDTLLMSVSSFYLRFFPFFFFSDRVPGLVSFSSAHFVTTA